MWTNSKLIRSLMISVLLGAAGTIAANPTGPETMVVQQGNKVTGLVEDQMGPVAGASERNHYRYDNRYRWKVYAG